MRALLIAAAVSLTSMVGGTAAAEPAPAERTGVTFQVNAPIAPVVTPPTPNPTPGDCSSWQYAFWYHGATVAEIAFFFGLAGGTNIIWRETRCGTDTLNDRTGDSGICQINPVHNRAGYFGGRYFGAGGWLGALHGLQTRVATDSHLWADACITLHRVCGTRPWQPPYGCSNRRLP